MVRSGAQYAREASSKGCTIQEFSVGDTTVGDEMTLHQNNGAISNSFRPMCPRTRCPGTHRPTDAPSKGGTLQGTEHTTWHFVRGHIVIASKYYVQQHVTNVEFMGEKDKILCFYLFFVGIGF
jgi:hypothetical protein